MDRRQRQSRSATLTARIFPKSNARDARKRRGPLVRVPARKPLNCHNKHAFQKRRPVAGFLLAIVHARFH
ncbi:hypothetical protein SCLCIDRAFT_899799 [Scleroderma citrinum Foug A]|uniref:Uncharacterized protein n=1 Tax=Scleroderma citrinum Foug A TaxID=1036808 RepID=A0A0C3A5A7_9AGAM|nr:hypothetical protein SCLCIDRAFT_899799 [Scleroderma citrinum Foug A]